MGLQLPPDFINVIQQFQVTGKLQDVTPYGEGHINDTYLVHLRESNKLKNRYILQRINHNVFKNPAAVMHNITRVTEHIRQKIMVAGGDSTRKTINLIPTRDNSSYYKSPTGEFWRVCHFIDGARTHLHAVSSQHSFHAGFAFGEFLALLSDFPISQLYETIPDFHHTSKRYQAFTRVVDEDPVDRVKSVRSEIEFFMERESEASILVDMLERGDLPVRVTHNDTKIDNVMIDDESGESLCVIDLDTVMPGLAVFDFGDAVRSGANLAAEDEPDPAKVEFSLDIFDHLAHGFLDAAREILTPVEINHLAFGAKMITLEQGVRFLTDYLSGDTYYKINQSDQNLVRTCTQLKLVAEMEKKFESMLAVIEKYQ